MARAEEIREAVEKQLDFIMMANPGEYYKNYLQEIYLDRTGDITEYTFGNLKITLEMSIWEDNSKVFIVVKKEHEEEVDP